MGNRGGKRQGAGRPKGSVGNQWRIQKNIYDDLIGSFKSGKHYVYYHINPTTKGIFYVGKGSGSRAWSNGRNKLWSDYILELDNYDVKIVCANISEEEALAIEKVLIEIHQPSCNIKHGYSLLQEISSN